MVWRPDALTVPQFLQKKNQNYFGSQTQLTVVLTPYLFYIVYWVRQDNFAFLKMLAKFFLFAEANGISSQ